MPRYRTDPELSRQLEKAAPTDEPVSAEFSLDTGEQAVLHPDEAERRVNELIRRVQDELGSSPQRLRVRKNLGAFSVTAAPAFIKKLAEQNEVASATASRQSEELLIKPHSTKRLSDP